jgi:flagellar hook-basal body complex protein FliE
MPFGFDEDKGEYIEVKGEKFFKNETKPETWKKIAPSWEQYLKQQGVTQDDVARLSPEVAAGKYYQPYTELVTQTKTPAKDTKDPGLKFAREKEEQALQEKEKKAFTFAEREQVAKEREQSQAILPGAQPLQEARQQKAELASTPAPTDAMAPTGAVSPAPVAPPPMAAPQMPMGGVPILQETQIQTTQMSPEFKKAQKQMEKSYTDLAKATAIKAQAEIADADAMAVASEKASMQMGMDLQTIDKTVSEYKEKLAETRERANQISQKLENYEIKGFFQGREGARVMAGIAVALGGIGSAFTGGPNQAMQIIQSSIDNDFAVQKANYEKLRGSLDATNTLYGQIRQAGLDEVSQKYTFMKTRYDQTIQQAKAIADKMSDPEKKARAQAVIEQLNIQKSDALMKAEEANKRTVITSLKPMTQGISPIDREKTLKEFEENVAKSPINEATQISQAASKFKQLRGMGSSEGALLIAEFIAGKQGLGQGSYSPAFADALRSIGLLDKPKEYIVKQITGAQSASVLNAIENFYETAARQSTQKAVEYAAAARFNDRARSVGYDPAYYFNQMHQPTLQKMFNTGGGQGVRRVP